ncbi:MAG: glycosyltransferase family 2 protein [Bacteroidales bacterium]|jgi:GT2 family glycosyltransferase|nr:glycosyltransferase family 2 protein [Bacteroidales bacterium]
MKNSGLSKPYVIVLILSYNGKGLLSEAISSYVDNSYNNFEVVVVDNGSTDNTKEYVESKFDNVKVLRTEVNLKYSGGLNFGMEYAFNQQSADYVLITNNDVKADKDLISSCVELAFGKDEIGFVTGKVYYYDHPNTFQSCGKSYDEKMWRGQHIGRNEEDRGQLDEDQQLPWCDDIFWLVSHKVYQKTGGGYDTEFAFQAEDFDWQVRAKKIGFQIWFASKAKLWHKDSMTIGKESAFKAYYNFRNPLIVHMKHRNYHEFQYYFKLKRNGLIRITIQSILRFRFKYLYYCWKGFSSAVIWGFSNNKLRLLNLFS